MTYTNKQKADVLREAAKLIRDGRQDWACSAIDEVSPYCLGAELVEYIRPFWNHGTGLFLSGSLLNHLLDNGHKGTFNGEFFRVAREKMLLAAADAMEKGLEP